jgi:cysteine desulfurase/selenocysteine lyase
MSFDAAAIRRDFPVFDNGPLHYLDHASSSQVPAAVIEALAIHDRTARANVHRSVYDLAERATAAYEGARANLARWINAPSAKEVIFTGGCTSAINLVAHSFGSLLEPGSEIIVSELDHHANIVPWQMLHDRRDIRLKVLPVRGGLLDLDALDDLVDARTRLIAVTHISNVTGAVTDVARVVEAARKVGARVLLDGAQAMGHGPVDVQKLGIDFYTGSAHKMYGPTGIGFLWAKGELLEAMPPFLGGGEMIRRVTMEATTYAPPPARFEAGTPPITQAAGLNAAVDWMRAQDWDAIGAHERRLTEKLLQGLGEIDGIRIAGPEGLQGRIAVVSFAHETVHAHDISEVLNEHHVAVRGGHHCAQPLLDALDEAALTRVSLGAYATEDDIDAFLAGLRDAIRRLA